MKLVHFKSFELCGFAVASLVFAPLLWMAMDRDPPLVVTAVAAPDRPVDRLGSLRLRYDAIYLRPGCSGEGRRKFVDVSGRAVWTEPYDFRTGIGFDGKPIQVGKATRLPPVLITVPLGVTPGPTTYQNDVRFYCNPLQKMLGRQWPWLSIAFTPPPVDFVVAATIDPHPRRSTHIFEAAPPAAADPGGPEP